MSRRINQLKTTFIQSVKEPGRYFDGAGLYLQVTNRGSKSWLFRFSKEGKEHRMGLGPIALVSLSEARHKALSARKRLLEGYHPLKEKLERLALQNHKAKTAKTFDQCRDLYLEQHKPAWDHLTYRQWKNSLNNYVTPVFGNLPVSEIDTNLVLKVLTPLWNQKTETANRVRNRIELILDFAKVHGHRSEENPAKWRGHLDNLLPKRSKVKPVQHFKALPVSEIPRFISQLRSRAAITARALEFLILTATRTNEVLEAKWSEINFVENVWIIPASRMKARREHRVPLCSQTGHILEKLRDSASNQSEEYIFPSANGGKPLSSNALLNLLERMRVDVTVHGFRSTFRDWAGERTNHPREVIEMALAHSIKDKAEAAYARGDLLNKRRTLMKDWEKFCDSKTNVNF